VIRGRDWSDESGMSMVLVIGISGVLVAASILATTLVNRALGGSSGHVSYEQALHLAEEGVDQVLARVQADDTYSTGQVAPAAATPAEEEAWAAELLATAPVIEVDEGEYAFIKPANRSVVYAAGWVPDRASALRPRYLKAEYLFSTYNPPKAILIGGDLVISGNADVSGIAGDVHSNGDIELSGSPTISGDLTSSGSISVGGGGGTTGVAGDVQSDASPQFVPPVEPREMWELLHADYADSWYDLCPDGTVRRADASTPCNGTISGSATSGQAFRGWTFHGTGSSREWQKDGSGEYSGVYYVYQAGANVSKNPGEVGNPWRATVIAESANADGACPADWGDIHVNGTPRVVGFIDGLALVAGRDLKIQGNANQRFEGLMAAHEQVEVSGNPTLVGALVAEDACDTPGSPVTTSSVSGSMAIVYDGNLDVQLANLIRTSLWLEL
jgi:cytoskeletal protein CcmA (bactofilin family)